MFVKASLSLLLQTTSILNLPTSTQCTEYPWLIYLRSYIRTGFVGDTITWHKKHVKILLLNNSWYRYTFWYPLSCYAILFTAQDCVKGYNRGGEKQSIFLLIN